MASAKHGRGGRSVPRDVAGFGGNFTDELGTHVFVRALQFDFLGDRNAVLGHGGGAELFVDDDIATGRSEGRFDRAGQFFHSAEEGLAG